MGVVARARSIWCSIDILEGNSKKVQSRLEEVISSQVFLWNSEGFMHPGNFIHGPFLLEKLSAESYIRVSHAVFETTLQDFTNACINDENFSKEIVAQIKPLLKNEIEIFLLGSQYYDGDVIPSENRDLVAEWHPFTIFLSAIAIDNSNSYLIQIGED